MPLPKPVPYKTCKECGGKGYIGDRALELWQPSVQCKCQHCNGLGYIAAADEAKAVVDGHSRRV